MMDQQRIEEELAHLRRVSEELAHLRRVSEELSEIVAQQADEIDRLKGRVRLLIDRAAEVEAEGAGGVVFGDEQPPHY